MLILISHGTFLCGPTCSLSIDFDTLQLLLQIALIDHIFNCVVTLLLKDPSPFYGP